jgi:hypothetical protein
MARKKDWSALRAGLFLPAMEIAVAKVFVFPKSILESK